MSLKHWTCLDSNFQGRLPATSGKHWWCHCNPLKDRKSCTSPDICSVQSLPTVQKSIEQNDTFFFNCTDDSAATCCLVNIVNMWESSKSSKSLVVVLGKTSVLSCSVVPNFDATHGLRPVRLLCPRLCPGKNTGAGCHFLLQGILPTQGSNPSLLQADAFPSEPRYC